VSLKTSKDAYEHTLSLKFVKKTGMTKVFGVGNFRICLQYLLLLIIRVFATLTVSSQAIPSFSVTNFSKQSYRAENQNWSITEDSKGYIYAANNIGLLEFDGIEWGFYPSPNGTVIRSVAVDAQNRVFTSGYRELGYWERDSLGNLNYNSLTTKAAPFFYPNEEFWTTLVFDGKIYFHSFSSLFIYENDSFTIIRPGGIINSIGILNDKVVMHISNMGIYSVEGSAIVPFITVPEIRTALVRFMFMADEELFLIGTAYDGVLAYRGSRLEPYLPEWKSYFATNELNRGAVMNNGTIVFGTILDGISVFNPDKGIAYHVNNENGLQNNTILGIHNDRNNNTWLSLDRGIDFVSFTSDSSYYVVKADEVGSVYSAAVLNEMLYLGTNQGVFYRSWDTETEPFSFVEGTQGQAWNCNIFDNKLFVGHNNGTFLVDKNRAEKISSVSGGFSLVNNPRIPNSLIQSTYSNIVFFEKDLSKWKYAYALDSFNNLIRYLEPDHLNNLWASHMHRGVFCLKLSDRQDSILNERYFGAETFGRDHNIQVFQVEGRVVFTTGTMIYTYDDINDTIIPYLQMNRMVDKYSASHRIVPGPDHHYWFISSTGIALFKFGSAGSEKVKDYPIELFKDHLIIGYENVIPISATEGILCLDNGYAILKAENPDLSHLITDKRMSIKSIESSDIAGKVFRHNLKDRKIRIPYKQNSLLVRYSFPLYSNEQVVFQSYVEGIDTGWSASVVRPEFSFKRLPPGDYSIHVKASNNWLESSQINSFKLHVSPPWYLSGFSFLIYILVVFGTVFFSRRMLLSRFALREQKLREGKERELIRLRNENLNSELSYKSQELANSTMAIIKKNEFLLEIKEILKAQKEELGLRYPDKYFQKLIRKIDTNISSIDDWKLFETHFERAHEKFLHKLMDTYPSLSPGDLRLCAYLRMNLSSKEIAPLLKISVRGVENHRYKLRKKLNLKPEENLIDFILGL